MDSRHYSKDRNTRDMIINAIGLGNAIKAREVDKGHPKGPEIHVLSDTGIITIYNKYTKKMATRLIARPGQIERFYKDKKDVPMELIMKAIKYKELGWNEA